MNSGNLIVIAGTTAILAAFAGAILILKKFAPVPKERKVGTLKDALLGVSIWLGFH
jgi:hypothetical protein